MPFPLVSKSRSVVSSYPEHPWRALQPIHSTASEKAALVGRLPVRGGTAVPAPVMADGIELRQAAEISISPSSSES